MGSFGTVYSINGAGQLLQGGRVLLQLSLGDRKEMKWYYSPQDGKVVSGPLEEPSMDRTWHLLPWKEGQLLATSFDLSTGHATYVIKLGPEPTSSELVLPGVRGHREVVQSDGKGRCIIRGGGTLDQAAYSMYPAGRVPAYNQLFFGGGVPVGLIGQRLYVNGVHKQTLPPGTVLLGATATHYVTGPGLAVYSLTDPLDVGIQLGLDIAYYAITDRNIIWQDKQGIHSYRNGVRRLLMPAQQAERVRLVNAQSSRFSDDPIYQVYLPSREHALIQSRRVVAKGPAELLLMENIERYQAAVAVPLMVALPRDLVRYVLRVI